MTTTKAFYITFVMVVGQLCSFWRHNPFRMLGGFLLALPFVLIMLPLLGPIGRLHTIAQALADMEEEGELERYPNWAVRVMLLNTNDCIEQEDSDE